VKYSKKALLYQQQLDLLRKRGLIVDDDQKALHLLEKISYYRLSAYWYPFLKHPKHLNQFKEGSSFEQAFKLYCFDRELRQIILNDIEKIEIAIKARAIYVLSHAYGPLWYTDSDLYRNPGKHNETVSKLKKEITRSNEDFIQSFKAKYKDPMPPSWMTLELASFGSVSFLYAGLKPTNFKRQIARSFGLDDKTFSSWVHALVYVRNICAHHSRFWNRTFRITPHYRRSPLNGFLTLPAEHNRAYYILSMIQFLLKDINPKSQFKLKLERLFEKYPMVDPSAMGFPVGWKNESLWS